MIKKFSVKNFKNFINPLVIDFSETKEYPFNQHLLKNGLINKMLIYGKNNSGKTNLGAAIMDITRHLTDHNSSDILYIPFLCANSIENYVEFKYEFLINKNQIQYNYKKDENSILIYEELIVDEKILLKYNYQNGEFLNNIKEASSIDLNKRTNLHLSVLKFIYNNTIYWSNDNPIYLMMNFVNNMLWLKTNNEVEYKYNLNNNEYLHDFIIKNNNLEKFNNFLIEYDQNYNLCEINGPLGKKVIGVNYQNNQIQFDFVASSGTIILWKIFCIINKRKENEISFMFLDDFGAFYYYELSLKILNTINKESFQSILTSHNTFLIDNEIMRPDCYAILKDGKLKTFAESTNKTIRLGHNLEKMMLGKEFDN